MAPLTRRRSARLASNSKPVGSAATPNLDSLVEQNEHPEQCSSPAVVAPRTPAGSSPTKPSNSEMHPSKAHGPKAQSSSALRLGFTDIGSARQESPTTAKSIKTGAIVTAPAVHQDTPSKQRSPLSALSPFTFRFSRRKGEAPIEDVTTTDGPSTKKPSTTLDLGLSDEARRLMEELRGEAQKIRADLEVEREQEKDQADEDGGRRIAKPKSRAGRFSAAHSAQFGKMDSITNHASAFRAAKFTPVKSTAAPTSVTPVMTSQVRGLKRTQSKANLDDTPKQKVSKTPAVLASESMSTTTKGRYNPLFTNSTSSVNNNHSRDDKQPQSVRKGNLLFRPADEQPLSAAKRLKQHVGDDASSTRPMSRDGTGSSLPRPAGTNGSVSSLTRSHTTTSLLTPTKSALARSTNAKTPVTNSAQPKTPGKTPSQLFSALKKSATMSRLHASTRAPPVTLTSEKVASTPKPQVARPGVQKTVAAVPAPSSPVVANSSVVRTIRPVTMAPTIMALSKTPAPPRITNRALPRFPATTPRRKLSKHVAFTPGTQRAILSEHSPSIIRSGIPRSALKSHEAPRDTEKPVDLGHGNNSPSIRRRFASTVYYPDLSGHELLGGSESSTVGGSSKVATVLSPSEKLAPSSSSVPGTFTFRSDKTINFGPTSPTGFGSSPGQSSIRQVRSSTSVMPKIPGSFPGTSQAGDMFTALVATDGPNKENTRPIGVNIIPHGITNKKRHRISEAEEDAEQEAAERATKRRKNHPVPEGDALLAPRLAGKSMPSANGPSVVKGTPRKTSPQKPTTFSTPGGKTPASIKKRPVLSLSRLNSLARPKLRK